MNDAGLLGSFFSICFLIDDPVLMDFFVMQIAFTRQKDFGKEARELKWAHAQRTLHGLQPPDTKMFTDRTNFTELNQMAEEAKRRAEIARWAPILATSLSNLT